jgi:hypothetical protein
MKFLIILLTLFCSVSFAKEDSFAEYLYKESGWDIWLYTCTKTAACLGVEEGWGQDGDKGKNDPTKFVCILFGGKLGGKDLEIDNGDMEKLQSIWARCRANSLKLLEDK